MVYITGDLHGEWKRFAQPALKRLRRGDTLIVCGDFGFVWDGSKGEQRLLKKLGKLRYQVAFLDGVHENHELLAAYPVTEWNGGRVHQISGRLLHLMRGQVYRIEGQTFFTLGGGENRDTDSEDAKLQACLPTLEDLYEANRNLQQYDYVVDYVLTHDCTGAVKNFLDMDCNSSNHLYTFLNEAAKIIEFKLWYFGSQHLDKLIPPKYVGVFQEVRRAGEGSPQRSRAAQKNA